MFWAWCAVGVCVGVAVSGLAVSQSRTTDGFALPDSASRAFIFVRVRHQLSSSSSARVTASSVACRAFEAHALCSRPLTLVEAARAELARTSATVTHVVVAITGVDGTVLADRGLLSLGRRRASRGGLVRTDGIAYAERGTVSSVSEAASKGRGATFSCPRARPACESTALEKTQT